MELIALSSEDRQHILCRNGGGGHGSDHRGGTSESTCSSQASTLSVTRELLNASEGPCSCISFTFPGTTTSATVYLDGGGKSTSLGSSSTLSGRQAGGRSRAGIPCDITVTDCTYYESYMLSSAQGTIYEIPVPVSNNYEHYGDLKHSPIVNLLTDSDSDNETPENALNTIISPSILTQLAPFNLAGCLARRRKVVSGGAYGDISKGRCRSQRTGKIKVAIKCLRFHLLEDIKTLFEKEIYVWSKLKHVNVLPLLGFDIDTGTGYPLLVSGWMDNGSAWAYVNAHPEVNPMHLITGIACGLAYLHGKGVVHSDIKSDNVVVSSSGDALICDFGCSRMIAASRSLAKPSSGIKGTTRYLAPELLTSVPEPPGHTMKTDVWAFGVTVYELISRQRPYANLSDHQVIFAIVVGRERPLFAQDLLSNPRYEVFVKVCSDCWRWAPEERPDMLSISSGLKPLRLQRSP